jgi:outer membrane protein insertion porin family
MKSLYPLTASLASTTLLSIAIAPGQAQTVVPTAPVSDPLVQSKSVQVAPSQRTPKGSVTVDAIPMPEFSPSPQTSPQPATPTPPAVAEPRVQVAEVVVCGATGELLDEIYNVVQIKPGMSVTRSQLQADLDAIGKTGYFRSVRAEPQDTPLGVRVTFVVEPNPVLRSVQVQNNQVLPAEVVNASFADQYGKVLNLRQLEAGIQKLNQWYQTNGYVLAQVVGEPQLNADGAVVLDVVEGTIEAVQIKFLNEKGEDKDAQGKPIQGRTRDFVITREMQLKPRTIFSQTQAQQDLQRVFRLGLFDDVKLSLSPGQDPRKAIVVVNVAERKNFAISPNVGYGSTSGLYAGGNFQANNLGGNNQKLSGEVQWSQRGLQFDANFTDPWIGGDPNRTAYTVNGFKRESIPLVFDGGTTEVTLPNGDRPRVDRTGGGVTFSRPLSETPLGKPEWSATAGLQYQRVAIRDGDGDLSPQDERGNPLSFSGSGKDDLLTASLGVVQDRRNDPLRPTQGSLLRLSTEQSVPIGEGNILFNRLRGSYSLFLPTSLTKFTSGCRQQTPTAAECPQAFAFNVQAGTVIGDLPPYEAFSLGGSNSVRGYGEGDVGSARSFAQISAEYRFPIVSIVNGALFVDAATDFGSGSSVPGDPAGERDKPGIGLGYGLGLRVQSPIGPVRVDFGLNDQGDSRFQFGIGERF